MFSQASDGQAGRTCRHRSGEKTGGGLRSAEVGAYALL
jgi:hypothetical protein